MVQPARLAKAERARGSFFVRPFHASVPRVPCVRVAVDAAAQSPHPLSPAGAQSSGVKSATFFSSADACDCSGLPIAAMS
jgi:hypothetical protein